MNQPFPLKGWKFLFPLVLFVSVLLLVKCEEESSEPRDYPRLTGMQISNISDEGATFTADLYSLGSSSILQHGFLWGNRRDLDLEYHDRIYLGPLSQTGFFSAEIRTALTEGKEYFVRPFVTIPGKNIYGPVISFKSHGSTGPVITGFQPDSAMWADTLKIFGRNFSWVTNEVFLNEHQLSILKTCDTLIIAVVESTVKSKENNLTVSTSEIRNTFLTKKFRLIPPSLTDFNPKQAYWGDTLSIKGKRLSYISTTGSFVKIGTLNCPVIYEASSDSVIKIKVPYELTTSSNILTLNVNGFSLTGSSPLTLLAPVFTFTPVEGTWGNTVTLTGRFNSIANRNTFYFNSTAASVQQTSGSSVTLVVPDGLADIRSYIKYDVVPFNVTSTEQFTLLPPEIISFSPVSGAGGTIVTITGKNFSTRSATVRFGDTLATVLSKGASSIVVKAPSDICGPVKIKVKAYNQETTSANDFDLTNPNITGFSPSTGSFNDVVNIYGTNFTPGNLSVWFGNYNAEIVSATQNQIIAKVPVALDSIPASVKVTVNSNPTTTVDKFTLLPPVISSVAPLIYSLGDDIVITGQNFNPDASKNRVFIDMVELRVKSSNPNQIIATCPNLPRGNFRIQVQTGGYKRYSTEIINVSSAWLRIPAPKIRTSMTNNYYGIRNYGAGIKNIGYVVSASMRATYKFNPADQSWEMLSGYPFGGDFYGPGSTVLGDTLYIVGGYYWSNNIMHAYDPTANNWRRLGDFNPRQAGVLFGIGKKLWFGMDFPYRSNKFWEIDALNNYSYVSKGTFPEASPSTFASYFMAGNKGYVILENNQVWEFNPVTETWMRKNDFPGSTRIMALSFVIGDYAYFGLGRNPSSSFFPPTVVYDDIWKYDYLTDSWSLATRIPASRYSATVFTLNDKAYIGFGFTLGKELYDFYEYDPAY